jgi:SAM-dependent methyltransferase
MIERDVAFRNAVRGRYNGIAVIWDRSDSWHERVRQEIRTAVERLRRLRQEPFKLVVDVGSGGFPQDLGHRHYVQIDIAESRLADAESGVCADAHALPLRDAAADCLLCLGSVANYCSLIELAQELGRVSEPGGMLLFHVELSNSLEYLGKAAHGSTAAFVTTHYQGKAERTWVYSDRAVRQALADAGFDVIDRRYFHVASALAYRLGLEANVAATFAFLDVLLSRLPGVGSISDGVILTCRRKAS